MRYTVERVESTSRTDGRILAKMGCSKMIDRRLMKKGKEDEQRRDTMRRGRKEDREKRRERGRGRGRKGREDGERRKREEGRSHDGSCPKGKDERSFSRRGQEGIT